MRKSFLAKQLNNKRAMMLFMCFQMFHTAINAQSVAINTDGSAANASALLDVKSTAKGILVPRMSRTERDAIASPATGLLIFQSGPDSVGFHYFDGTRWTWIFSNSNTDSLAWRTKGNTGTSEANNFIGTIDDVALNFRVNNQKAGRIPSSGETFLGYQSGAANTSNYSTGFGYYALASNTSGNDNTAVGREALRFNTTGGANTATGKESLFSNTTGTSNVASGYQSMVTNSTGSNNTGIGTNSLRGNTTASNNTALGYNSMRNNTTGSDNVAIGTDALSSNLTGIKNVAIAGDALFSNNSGDQNIGIGYFTLFNNTSGSRNVSVGEGSAIFNTTGSTNTTVGFQPLFSNTTGYSNVAIGVQSLYSNSTASNLVAVGDSSLFHSTGSGNTAFGSKAGYNVTSGSNNVFLGNQAGYNVTTGSNKLYIANNSTDPPIIYGDFSTKVIGLGTITPNSTYGYAKLEIASEGYASPSDILIRNAVNDAGYAPGLNFQHARGTLAAPLAVVNGDYMAAIASMNYDGTSYVQSAGIDIWSDGAVSTGKVPTKIHFYTMNSSGSLATRMVIKNDGKVGIGTTNPLAHTHISNGNFLVDGNFGTDSTLGFSGSGTRMFFYPRKAAFRAGNVSGTQWDDANIGNYSIAMGLNPRASSDYSVAIGEGNIAETSLFAMAIGRENHSTGFASLAMGHFSEATGDYSASIGLRDTVSAFGASSMGSYNKVSNAYAFAAGFSNTVAGVSAMATGNNNYAPSFGETTIGNYATQYSALSAGGVNSSDRVFTIGNGTSTGSRADAMVVLKDGRVGIGVSTPSTQLTNNSSNTVGVDGFGLNGPSLNWSMNAGGYVAGIFNASTNTNTNGLVVKIAGTDISNRILDLSTNASQTTAGTPVMVANGNGTVGIGTSAPNSTLQVDGTIAVGLTMGLAGGPSGSPISLATAKYYIGLSPADAVNNNYQLPSPVTYPGRVYFIRNNSSANNAVLTTAAGLLFPAQSATGIASYGLNAASSVKSVMVISDGSNWTVVQQN